MTRPHPSGARDPLHASAGYPPPAGYPPQPGAPPPGVAPPHSVTEPCCCGSPGRPGAPGGTAPHALWGSRDAQATPATRRPPRPRRTTAPTRTPRRRPPPRTATAPTRAPTQVRARGLNSGRGRALLPPARGFTELRSARLVVAGAPPPGHYPPPAPGHYPPPGESAQAGAPATLTRAPSAPRPLFSTTSSRGFACAQRATPRPPGRPTATPRQVSGARATTPHRLSIGPSAQRATA